MSEVITFDEAIKKSKKSNSANKPSVLMGNGFSIDHFSYASLLEEADIEDGTPLRQLFNDLDTNDFEIVIQALEDASRVARAYNHKQAEKYEKEAKTLRAKLVTAIRSTHPHLGDINDSSCIEFLGNFDKLFTLNYDLLLYWLMQSKKKRFSDGFGLSKDNGIFRGPFKENAKCNTYNLHGGLHLFQKKDGHTEKILKGNTDILNNIESLIMNEKRMPLYVAEGSSDKKMRKIKRTPYLRHAYDALKEIEGDLFVFGHSADKNDEHIYEAIFKPSVEHSVKHLYFCIYTPTANIADIKGKLADYKDDYASNLEYTFVCSESAKVWNNS